MTLRDYFAGQALAGYCAQENVDYLSSDDVAQRCVNRADALLHLLSP